MELEQRITLLEQEVKLLKNQVQATLLDIQEQLLSTRFSDLRAEASPRPEARAEATDAARAERRTPPPSLPAGVRVAKLADATASEPAATRAIDAEPPQPVRSPNPAAKPAKVGTKPTASTAAISSADLQALTDLRADGATAPDASLDWELLRRQTDWSIQTLREHGPVHTRQLIEAYAQNGLLSDKIVAVLQHVVAAFQEEAAPADNHKAAPHTAGEPAAEIKGLDKTQQSSGIRRIITYLQATAARPGGPHG